MQTLGGGEEPKYSGLIDSHTLITAGASDKLSGSQRNWMALGQLLLTEHTKGWMALKLLLYTKLVPHNSRAASARSRLARKDCSHKDAILY